MLSYHIDTYNYDRGAFCNCREPMVAVTAKALCKGLTPKIERKRRRSVWSDRFIVGRLSSFFDGELSVNCQL